MSASKRFFFSEEMNDKSGEGKTKGSLASKIGRKMWTATCIPLESTHYLFKISAFAVKPWVAWSSGSPIRFEGNGFIENVGNCRVIQMRKVINSEILPCVRRTKRRF